MDLDLITAVKSIAAGHDRSRPQVSRPDPLKGERAGGLDAARTGNPKTIVAGRSNKEIASD